MTLDGFKPICPSRMRIGVRHRRQSVANAVNTGPHERPFVAEHAAARVTDLVGCHKFRIYLNGDR